MALAPLQKSLCAHLQAAARSWQWKRLNRTRRTKVVSCKFTRRCIIRILFAYATPTSSMTREVVTRKSPKAGGREPTQPLRKKRRKRIRKRRKERRAKKRSKKRYCTLSWTTSHQMYIEFRSTSRNSINRSIHFLSNCTHTSCCGPSTTCIGTTWCIEISSLRTYWSTQRATFSKCATSAVPRK